MTREEAIEVLRKNRPGADPRRCGLELCTAVDVAIAALKERENHFREATKKDGCDWCQSLNKPFGEFGLGDMLAIGHVEYTFIGDGRMYQQKVRFCPLCGKDLEEQE